MNKKFDAFIAKPGMAWPVDDLSTPINSIYTATFSQEEMDEFARIIATGEAGIAFVCGRLIGALHSGRQYMVAIKKNPEDPPVKKTVKVKPKVTRFDYQDVCGDCGKRLYGAARRDMGAITISMGICPICHEEKGIVPARDWYYSHEDKVTVEDWD